MHPKAMEIADKIYGGSIPCDLKIEEEMEKRRLNLAADIDAALKAERREALEAACKAVCPNCKKGWLTVPAQRDGQDGYWSHEIYSGMRGVYCCASPIHELMAKEGD